MKKILIVVLICICIFTAANSVSANNMYAAWDTDNSAVWVYGAFENCQDKDITFTIVPSGETEYSDRKLPVDVRIDKTDENGKFAFKIPLKTSGGIFDCLADTDAKSGKCSFTFIDEDASTPLITTLNALETTEDMASFLNSNYTALGVDTKLVNSELCNKLLAGKPFENSMDFYKEYLAASAIIKLKNGNDVLPVISQYRYVLGVSPELIENFTDSQFGKMKEVMQNANLSVENFKEDFPSYVFLTKVVSLAKFKDLRTLIESEGEEYGFSVGASSEYSSLNLKDNVFSYMISHMANTRSLESAVSLFNEAVTETKKIDSIITEDDDKNTLGGGGVGGSKVSDPVDEPEKENFSDISSHWAKEYIEKLVADGAVNGYPDGTFRPDNTITRAEFIKLVCEIAGLTYGQGCNFSDVSENDWFYPYVSIAYEKGIVVGSGNSFMPNNAISRQDAAVILHRYLKVGSSGAAGEYTDFDEISEYAVEAVSSLSSVNIIKGDGNNFMPLRNLTRAEAVTLFYNAGDYFERQGEK